MSDKDSIGRVIGVALALCVVCAVIVSTAAVQLKPAQQANKTLDLKRNILQAAGLYDATQSVEDQFAKISTKVVDLRSGQYTDQVDPSSFDQRKASKDPALSAELSDEEDIAKLSRREHFSLVYLVEGDSGVEKSFCPSEVMVSGPPYTGLLRWNLMPTLSRVWDSMSTAKRLV